MSANHWRKRAWNGFLEGVEVIYPPLLSLIAVITDFVECLTNWFHAAFHIINPKTGIPYSFVNLKPDWFTILVCASIIPWYLLHRRNQKVSNAEAVENLKNNLSGIRHLNAYKYARAFIRQCHEELTKLEGLHEDDPDRMKKIAEALGAINICIRSFANDFLQLNGQSIGVNYMLYFDQAELTPDVINKMLAEESLCAVAGETAEGVLHLVPQLNSPIDPQKSFSRLSLPLYPDNRHVYNREGNLTDLKLPGAPLAYALGCSAIENTRDKEAYPKAVKDDIVTTLTEYFDKNARHTKGLLSFAIPPCPGQAKSIGVLNIETSQEHDYKADEHTFNNFYTMISSVLIIVDNHLRTYRNSVLNSLKTKHSVAKKA